MDRLFAQIKHDPLSMLPEKSLMVLDHFQAAYYTRLKMEGKSSEVPSLLKHFEQWLYGRFSMRPGPHGVFQIVQVDFNHLSTRG